MTNKEIFLPVGVLSEASSSAQPDRQGDVTHTEYCSMFRVERVRRSSLQLEFSSVSLWCFMTAVAVGQWFAASAAKDTFRL